MQPSGLQEKYDEIKIQYTCKDRNARFTKIPNKPLTDDRGEYE